MSFDLDQCRRRRARIALENGQHEKSWPAPRKSALSMNVGVFPWFRAMSAMRAIVR
jgi:hypothetical protein